MDTKSASEHVVRDHFAGTELKPLSLSIRMGMLATPWSCRLISSSIAQAGSALASINGSAEPDVPWPPSVDSPTHPRPPPYCG
jgi:hypothetical protein